VSSGEINPSARWPVARERLITAAASATTAIAPIADGVACFIEPFISLCRCRVKTKNGMIHQVKYWEIIADNLSNASWSWGCVSAIDSYGS
jgi:hypothetical protein